MVHGSVESNIIHGESEGEGEGEGRGEEGQREGERREESVILMGIERVRCNSRGWDRDKDGWRMARIIDK